LIESNGYVRVLFKCNTYKFHKREKAEMDKRVWAKLLKYLDSKQIATREAVFKPATHNFIEPKLEPPIAKCFGNQRKGKRNTSRNE